MGKDYFKSPHVLLAVSVVCLKNSVCSEEQTDVKRKRQTESERDSKSTDRKMGLTS